MVRFSSILSLAVAAQGIQASPTVRRGDLEPQTRDISQKVGDIAADYASVHEKRVTGAQLSGANAGAGENQRLAPSPAQVAGPQGGQPGGTKNKGITGGSNGAANRPPAKQSGNGIQDGPAKAKTPKQPATANPAFQQGGGVNGAKGGSNKATNPQNAAKDNSRPQQNGSSGGNRNAPTGTENPKGTGNDDSCAEQNGNSNGNKNNPTGTQKNPKGPGNDNSLPIQNGNPKGVNNPFPQPGANSGGNNNGPTGTQKNSKGPGKDNSLPKQNRNPNGVNSPSPRK